MLNMLMLIVHHMQSVFIFYLSTGYTTTTVPYDWRPSFPGSLSKNMEQPAVGSDVI